MDAGPWLICVPLSTLRNWEREFSVWCPQVNVVSYTGSGPARKIIRDFEFTSNLTGYVASSAKVSRTPSSSALKFHVLLTSYEMILADFAALGSINWRVREAFE